MKLNVDELKKYLKIEFEDDDELLAILFDAAKETLAQSGVSETVSDKNKYKLAIYMLVAHYYENRGEAGSGNAMPPGMPGIIEQLRRAETEGE